MDCLISREQALKVAISHVSNIRQHITAEKEIERIPVENRWIPLEEKRPDQGQPVIIKIESGKKIGMAYLDSRGKWRMWETDQEIEDPLKWMPLLVLEE